MTKNATDETHKTEDAKTEGQTARFNDILPEPPPGAKPAAVAEAAAETPTGQNEEYERLRAERDGLFERLARLQAEFDNARKREQRAVEQFLPVLDNFKLALDSKGTAEQLRTGVELIAKQMDEVLRGLNVTPVETVGQPFDPRLHEALESVERTDLPDHQVIDEIRRGYRIKERLLRPALVRISVNPNVSEA
jgi:molecular chaperone GrpE